MAHGDLDSTEFEINSRGRTITGRNGKLENLNTKLVMYALEVDCPFELYWYDKTKGWKSSSSFDGYSELSDYDKLAAYRDYICEQVSYNRDAVDNDDSPYGDPWQLIYVFDGDPDTDVACEGYSKAFKYLCDLSTFSGDVACYIFTGFHRRKPHVERRPHQRGKLSYGCYQFR